MTTQRDYTAADWDLLVGAPALTALVIIHTTERCPRGLAERKLQAALTAMMEPTPPGPGYELIAAVLEAVRAGQSPRWPSEYPRELTDVGGWALERCRQITALLAQQAPEAEAEAFSQWLYAIGQQVALVPEEQILAGRAPTAPAHTQRSALDQLAAALELSFAADAMGAVSACRQAPLP